MNIRLPLLYFSDDETQWLVFVPSGLPWTRSKLDGSSRIIRSFSSDISEYTFLPSMLMWIHGIYEYYTKIDLWNMICTLIKFGLSHHNSTLASSHSYPITIVKTSFFVLLVWATLSVCSFPCGWNGSQRHVCVCAWCMNKTQNKTKQNKQNIMVTVSHIHGKKGK